MRYVTSNHITLHNTVYCMSFSGWKLMWPKLKRNFNSIRGRGPAWLATPPYPLPVFCTVLFPRSKASASTSTTSILPAIFSTLDLCTSTFFCLFFLLPGRLFHPVSKALYTYILPLLLFSFAIPAGTTMPGRFHPKSRQKEWEWVEEKEQNNSSPDIIGWRGEIGSTRGRKCRKKWGDEEKLMKSLLTWKRKSSYSSWERSGEEKGSRVAII